MDLPAWMGEIAESEEKKYLYSSKDSYLKKTIRELSRAMLELIRSERLARQEGWWQGLNPAVKLATVVVFIIIAGMAGQIIILIGLWLFCVTAMFLSRLPVAEIQLKLWGVIPFLTLIFSLPAALNLISPGEPLWWFNRHPTVLWGTGFIIPRLYLSKSGVLAALLLSTRVGVSLNLAALLILTTPMTEVLRSLRVFRVPAFMVMIMEMSYRYIALLLQCALEMHEARLMRTVGFLPFAKRAQLSASGIGSLFARSMSLADEVYMAMVARGYTGEVRLKNKWTIKGGDIVMTLITIGLLAFYWIGGLHG